MLLQQAPASRSTFFKQLFQYLIVGGSAFVVDFSILYGLTEYFHFHYLLSATAGFLVGLLVNYILCITWIFKYRALESTTHEFFVFALIGIIGLLLNNTLLYALTDGLEVHYLGSKLIAAGIVLIFNFSLRRHMLFSDTRYARWVRQSDFRQQTPSQ